MHKTIIALVFTLVLVVSIYRGKASINRFRTKPGDFKAKLKEMFVAYYKAELSNVAESRAALSRRYQMTPALFSRKLMELTEEERQEYSAEANAQIAEEKVSAAAAGKAHISGGVVLPSVVQYPEAATGSSNDNSNDNSHSNHQEQKDVGGGVEDIEGIEGSSNSEPGAAQI